MSALISEITPAFSEITTSPASTAARYSIPVPTNGASALIRGTDWRCMFEPINARLASSCSKNGIIAVATDQTCRGDTSMKSTSSGRTKSTSPPLRRTKTRSSEKVPSAAKAAFA